jgi:hypothetical protein
MRQFFSVLLWLLMTTAVSAGPNFASPLIAAPAPTPVSRVVPVNQVLEIAIIDMTPEMAKLVDLTYYPRPVGIRCKPVANWAASEYRIDFSAPVAGTYLIKIDSPSEQPGGAVVGAEIEITVDVQPGPVPPGPTPDPDPDPPTPVVQKCQIIVIEETADSTPEFAKIRNSEAIRQWATAGGHTIYFIDKDLPYTGPNANAWKSWQEKGKAKGTPYIFITKATDGAAVLYEGPCPTTDTAFRTLIRTWGGGTISDCPDGKCEIQLKGKK